jgi:hypothetical protein
LQLLLFPVDELFLVVHLLEAVVILIVVFVVEGVFVSQVLVLVAVVLV